MIINLTPHAVTVGDRTIQPTLPPARVSSTLVKQAPIDGLDFALTVFGQVENLPAPCWFNPAMADYSDAPVEDGAERVWYIVSAPVIAALPGRDDLVRPDTGPDAIRDDQGRIVAVRRLTR